MAEILEITEHPVHPKAGATLDYFTSGVWWAKEQNFTAEQTSAFFTVLHTLLDNIKGIHLTNKVVPLDLAISFRSLLT